MTNRHGSRSPSGFLFDQWSRYDALAKGVRTLAPVGGTVLDVGCGESMLLDAFLPEHEVSYIDPLLAERIGERTASGSIIGATLQAETVADGSFDVVVCVDVLEHVPANEREGFVAQMMRVSRLGVVISAPYSDVGDARHTDEVVHLAYRAKHGHDYEWLHDHEQYGLPMKSQVEQQLQAQGLDTISFGNGHTPWLQDLLALHVVFLDKPEHIGLLREIGDHFAEQLLPFDHLAPTYRQVLVGGRLKPAAPPEQDSDEATRCQADEMWTRFRTWVDARLATHADRLVEQRDIAQAALASTYARLASLRSEVADLRGNVDDEAESLDARCEEIDRLRRALEESDNRAVQLAADLHASGGTAEHLSELLREAQQDLTGVRTSLSWRITQPLRWSLETLRAVPRSCSRALLATANRAARSKLADRWRWPLKCTFFAIFKPLLANTREYADFLAAKRWRDVPAPQAPPLIGEPHATLPDVLVFGVIDWRLRTQRPQHLALELARRGHRVIYLSPGFASSSDPGYELELVAPSPPVHQVHLHTNRPISIYEDVPPPATHEFLAGGLRHLLGDIGLSTCIALVDHPCWVDLVLLLPRCIRVYDCMDNHHGFAESGSGLPRAEERLLASTDAVIVTSNQIERDLAPRHTSVHMVRNACAPEDFALAKSSPASNRRPVIGYFGAIAAWFDAELLRDVASAMPDCDFLLVGDDTAGVRGRMRGLDNVRFTGEVAYDQLPEHLRVIDVLLIPFVIDPLTLATNPVKAYEALAAGKPVVATPMPELIETDVAPFVRIGATGPELVTALRAALAEAHDPEIQARRIAFARQQTWCHRAEALCAAVHAAPRPRVAAVVVSWNGVELTRRCVQSLLDDPLPGDLDIIVVDNDSQDLTPAWLDEIEKHERVRVIRNDCNRGFAAACNQGLAAGAERDPDMLLILNNDLVVTPGWTWTLHHHLKERPDIGLIGPVTNNIGNEAKIATAYATLDEMQSEQRSLTGMAAGRTFDIPVLAFFCVAMPLDIYRQIGGLDENFGTGFFEDDDYCQRVGELGRRIVCAEDVFVHHELSASFDRIDQGERQQLFERNRAYYESKWGQWRRHEYRARSSG